MKAILLFTGAGELLSFLFTIGICLLIFLAIRAIMLWYWKIDTIVLNQEKQLAALSAILRQLKPNGELSDEEKSKRFDEALAAANRREQSKI